MAKEILPIDPDNETFDVFFSRFNEVAETISNNVVTTGSSADGDITPGNVFIQGILGANTLAIYNTIRGGSVSSANDLAIGSNVKFGEFTSHYGNTSDYVVIHQDGISFPDESLAIAKDEIKLKIESVETSLTANQLKLDDPEEEQSTILSAAGLNVGDGVIISNASITVGNSTVNAVINSTAIVVERVVSDSTLAVVDIYLGNSSSNTYVNSSVIELGDGMVGANQSHLRVGNSAINAVSNSSSLTISTPAAFSTVNSTSFNLSNSTVSFSLIKPTASQSSDGEYFLNANGSWAQIIIPDLGISNLTTTTTGTSAQLFDSFEKSSIRSVEYTISITNNSANGYQAQKLLAFHYDSDMDITEYGILTSNNILGSFSANVNTTHGRIYFTPGVNSTTIKYFRFAVNA